MNTLTHPFSGGHNHTSGNLFPDPKGGGITGTPGGRGGSSSGSGGRYKMAGGGDAEEDDVGTGLDDDGLVLAPGQGPDSALPPLQEHQVQLVDEVQRRWEAERERREQMEKVSFPLHIF